MAIRELKGDEKPNVMEWSWFRKDRSALAYEIGFFGVCLGVTLSWRGEGDPHVTFSIVVEDDGNWSVQSQGGTSSGWLVEMGDATRAAYEWMEQHCVKEKYGYVFKGRLAQEST